MKHVHPTDQRCPCCGLGVVASRCSFCEEAVRTNPSQVCLLSGESFAAEAGHPPAFAPLEPDHETAWRARST